MGFVIRMEEADWTIPEENTEEALEEVNNTYEEDYDNLQEAFREEGRWRTETTDEGVKVKQFVGEKAGWGEEAILSTVSQFVEDGDYVQMTGVHRGNPYRLVSKGNQLKTVEGEVVFK